MNSRKGTIVKANSLNSFAVRDDEDGCVFLFSIYCGDSWGVIQEFHEFNYHNLVGRKVLLDFDVSRIISRDETRGGVQWETVRFFK